MLNGDQPYDLRVTSSFKIGRSPLCNIILKDGHVSKVHCSFNICDSDHDSVESKSQVLISDHSSNGTWISSENSRETTKLEREKPTLLKEGDVILLTRSTAAHPEVIAYKYCSSPFPSITKFIYKPEQPNSEIREFQAEDDIKDNKTNTSLDSKRKLVSDGEFFSPKKVRFKGKVEENNVNDETLVESPVKNVDLNHVIKKSNLTTQVENSTTFDNVATTTTINYEKPGITCTDVSTSRVYTSSSTESRPKILEVTKSDKKHDLASGLNVPEDDIHHDKCTQCGKWIPHVTASLHEAVCEGQSLEAKSQDHVSLGSASFEGNSFKVESDPGIESPEKLSANGDENYTSVCSEAKEQDAIGEANSGYSDPGRIEDETCVKTILESPKTLSSTSCHPLVNRPNSDVVSTSTDTSCKTAGKMEESADALTKISKSTPEQCEPLLCSDKGDTRSTSPHGGESTLEREESKERCTFCSKVLPVSELVHHASECSRKSAVFPTDSDDTEDMHEACPYCGKHFEVLELVEHVTRCKDLSRIKAEEVSQEDADSPFSPELEGSYTQEDPSEGDRELCPKCRREFPLMELVKHASECTQEKPLINTRPDVESPRDEISERLDTSEVGGDVHDADDESGVKDKKLCPKYQREFPLLELVNHASRCKQEEPPSTGSHVKSPRDETSELLDNSDVDGDSDDADDESGVKDKELCPKCRREFPLLELVNHASECKQEEPRSVGSDVESSRDENSERLDTSDVDDANEESEVKDAGGTGDFSSRTSDDHEHDENKLNDEVCPGDDDTCGGKDNAGMRETDHYVGSGSASEDVEGDESDDDREDEDEVFDEDSNDRDDDDGEDVHDDGEDDDEEDDDDYDSCRRYTDDDDVTHSDSSHDDDHSDGSNLSDRNSECYEDCVEYDEEENESSTHGESCGESKRSGDECVDAAAINDKDDERSDDFEFCPNCRKLFHLSLLVEHASICRGRDIFHKITAVSSEISTGLVKSASCDQTAGSSVVFSDCPFCGIKLPIHVMSVHYPKCEKLYLEKGSSTGSSILNESRAPAGDLPGAGHIDNLSSRITVKGDRNTKRPISVTAKTSDTEEPSTSSKSKVARFHAATANGDGYDDRKTSESSVLKRTTSSLDSYHDCEEQCMYCLKMFAVNVLVEHACNCAGRQESSADANELEQCCYCLQTFPLNELIEHAQNCDLKTVSSSQEDVQDDVTANSQSDTGKVLERCMYCFKDFPVSKLIRHSQKCDGDMSGPRERFQGFLPSVHDLSAISSVAILNDTQRTALQHVITRSAQDSKRVSTNLLARVQRLGYSDNDLKRTLQWIRSAAPIIIHINLDRVLNFLVRDTHYRNQFETGTSGGSTDKIARKSWEDRIFNNAYHSSSPSERVKYGVLNIVGDPSGVRSCIHYGDSFLQLKKVRLRTTFASMDTSGAGVKLSCCEHYENVLFSYTNQEITAIMDVATGKVPFHRSDCISHYKEVQIHGPVSLSENVECIVVNSRHQGDPRTTKLLDRFVEQNKCNLIWMDPGDVTGAAPLFGMAPYYAAGAVTPGLLGHLGSLPGVSVSRSARGRRGRGRSKSRRKHPY